VERKLAGKQNKKEKNGKKLIFFLLFELEKKIQGKK